ncbi:MAG: cupin domain-containing protein [Dermatophilaceae bacterium]
MTRAQDNPAGRLGDLFDNAAADTLLADRGLRTPFLRVAKDGRTYAAGDFTAPGGVGAEIGDQLDETKLLDLFADGATLVLQGLHRTWAPIRAFAADLAADIGHPVQVNAYVTPPQNTGFSDHYDVHDVFVVQVAGSKTWRIRPPVLRHPLRSQPWENRRAAVQEAATRPPLLETTLEPGDVLYLPRGFIHAATARGAVSTHLTIGIHTWTGHHVGERLMSYAARRLAADPSVRASLPLGIDLSGPDVASNPAVAQAVEIAREVLIAALREAPADVVLRDLAGPNRSGTRPAAVGPIASVEAANAVTADAVLVLRRHLAATLSPAGEGLVLDSRAGRRAVSAADAAAVRALLSSGRARAGDLGLDLARRLIRAGVAVVEAAGASAPGSSAERPQPDQATADPELTPAAT